MLDLDILHPFIAEGGGRLPSGGCLPGGECLAVVDYSTCKITISLVMWFPN